MATFTIFEEITPSDSNSVSGYDAVLIEKSGTGPAVVKMTAQGGPPENDTSAITISCDADKTILPFRPYRVYATGTSGATVTGLK